MKISLALKALRELGPQKLGLIALYRAGLKLGYFRWKTDDRKERPEAPRHPLSFPLAFLNLPDPDTLRAIIGPEGLSQLKAEADAIVDGRVRLFGGPPVPLNLSPPGELSHWTDYARGKSAFPAAQSAHYPIPDIKYIWEPARFGWAFTLGRAYHLTSDERYPEAFWRYFETFRQANPVNQGPNWESAQEVALRLMAFTFAAQIFGPSSHTTAPRTLQLAQAISEHAARIPPTLIYARAQNNNHLLSESTGLITASRALPDHPESEHWAKLGWKWFARGLQSQIAADGSYMQQSTNYHRLVLQLALWVYWISGIKPQVSGENLTPDTSHLKLYNATRWLLNLCDPASGRVPNLGPNDGAYILPLTMLPFADYRPVLQAAAQTFLAEAPFEPGPWDEMSLWLTGNELSVPRDQSSVIGYQAHRKGDHRILNTDHSLLHANHSWAYLRAASFYDRPGHADQLHLDLWWRGLNIAQDAGTYLYNAAPPWDNALTHTAVHNTLMVDTRQQMTPAGRFLYLDRAQAEVLEREQAEDGSWERITARHNGYRRLGIVHTRKVTADQNDRWVVEDILQSATETAPRTPHLVRLHWLLPDWAYEIQKAEGGRREAGCGIRIKSPYGWIELTVGLHPSPLPLQLTRAGELLHGTGEISPTWGWISSTYGVKEPALSFAVTIESELPLTLTSKWNFPND